MGTSNFLLQGGFESFDGHMVLYGYDKNYNDCPAFGIMDSTLQSFDYYILNDLNNNNVSFIDGCCGMDANGSDVDYLFVRDDGIISAIQPACSIPICQDYNQYIDIYGSYLKVQKMELNHHTPYSPILVSGIKGGIGKTSVLTETYDISSSVCDHPLSNFVESIIPDIHDIDYYDILQMDTTVSQISTSQYDSVFEDFLCVDENAYSLIDNGEENKKSLKVKEQHVDILFVSNRQFVCHDFIGEIQYAVYATDGRLVMKGSTNNGVAINLSSALRGVYLLKAEDKSGNHIVKKMVL